MFDVNDIYFDKEVSSDSDSPDDEWVDKKVYIKPLYRTDYPALPSTGILGGPHIVVTGT